MPNMQQRGWPLLWTGLATGSAHAAPIEGEMGSNAAVILVLLGVWALILGMRNLRELRHKRLAPERPQIDENDARLRRSEGL